jgi:hypothetical protein
MRRCPQKESEMPIYRNVSKANAATPEAAAKFILYDTGGVVQHANAWPILDEEDCWRVPVFSTDGRASMPFPVGAVFPKDNRMSAADIEKQINQFGGERPEFESVGGDGPGWELGKASGPGFRKQ